MTDFHSLCIRLIIATDADNAKAQDYIINQIRLALQKEHGCFMNEDEQQSFPRKAHALLPTNFCHDNRAWFPRIMRQVDGPMD